MKALVALHELPHRCGNLDRIMCLLREVAKTFVPASVLAQKALDSILNGIEESVILQ